MTESEAIDRELRCIFCDYNLRGLHVTAACPECGKPVEHTVALERTGGLELSWIDSMCAGAKRLLTALLAGVLAGVFAGLGYAFDSPLQVAVTCSLISASIVFSVSGSAHIAKRDTLRNRYAVSRLALAPILAVYTLLTLVSLVSYWMDEYAGFVPLLWDLSEWLSLAATAAVTVAAWGALHRLGHTLLQLRRTVVGIQFKLLSVLVPAGVIAASFVSSAGWFAHQPAVFFLHWPAAGIGAVALSGAAATDVNEPEVYLLLAIAVVHLWLFCVLLTGWLALRVMLAPIHSGVDESISASSPT